MHLHSRPPNSTAKTQNTQFWHRNEAKVRREKLYETSITENNSVENPNAGPS